MVIKKRKLGYVNFLGRPVSPIRNHKYSQPLFGFKPFKPSKPQPIKGYTGINMFSSIAIPRRQSTSLWNPHSKPGAAIWGDKDRDGVYNGFDCQPNNRRKQGPEHKKNRWVKHLDIGDLREYHNEEHGTENERWRNEIQLSKDPKTETWDLIHFSPNTSAQRMHFGRKELADAAAKNIMEKEFKKRPIVSRKEFEEAMDEDTNSAEEYDPDSDIKARGYANAEQYYKENAPDEPDKD